MALAHARGVRNPFAAAPSRAVAWLRSVGRPPAREEDIAVDTSTIIWVIVGIVVVAILVVVVLMVTARGRRDKRDQAQHEQAERIREEARESEIAAREHEAQAAQARADAASAAAAAEQAKARAAQASIDADRRAGDIDGLQAGAEKHRAEQAERLRKADEVDPYVTEERTDAAPAADTRADARRADAESRTAPAGGTRTDEDPDAVRPTTVDDRTVTEHPATEPRADRV